MSPKTLSTTELAHKLIADLTPLADMISPNDRRILKKFCEYILQQRVPIANATDLLPLEVALLVIQIEERKRTNDEIDKLYNYISQLRRENEDFKNLFLKNLVDEKI